MNTLKCLLVLILFPLPLVAQFEVTGKIVGQNNLPIALAEVSLLSNTNTNVNSQLTDNEGAFTLTTTGGTYTFQVKQLGKLYLEKTIQINQNLN